MNTPEQIDKAEPRKPGISRRSEFAVLVGMVLAIGSLYMTWELNSSGLSPGRALPLPGAMYSNMSNVPDHVAIAGFHTLAHWPLTVAALACGATMLFAISNDNRSAVLLLQGISSLISLLIPLRWLVQGGFKPMPGILVGALGALMLVYGAIERWRD